MDYGSIICACWVTYDNSTFAPLAASEWCCKIHRSAVTRRFLRPQPFGTCPLCLAKHSLHNHLAQSELIQGNFSTNWYLKAQLLSLCLAELRICRSLWGMQDNREKHSGNSQSENYPGKVLGGLKTICCMTPLIHLQCRGQNLYCLSGAAVPGPRQRHLHNRGRWRKRRWRSGISYTMASHALGQGGEAEAHAVGPLHEDACRQAEAPRDARVSCAGTAPCLAERATAPSEVGSQVEESEPTPPTALAFKCIQRMGFKIFFLRDLWDFKDTAHL